MDRRAGLQLGVLLLAVPVQYLVSQWIFSTESQRSYAIRNLLNEASDLTEDYFSWKSWKRWCSRLISNISPYDTKAYFEGQNDPDGESPAVEVINHMDPKGYFAASAEPREYRPPEVKYRIGQVIKHKRWGYRGVIVGWDEIAKAPEYWIKNNHPPGKEMDTFDVCLAPNLGNICSATAAHRDVPDRGCCRYADRRDRCSESFWHVSVLLNISLQDLIPPTRPPQQMKFNLTRWKIFGLPKTKYFGLR